MLCVSGLLIDRMYGPGFDLFNQRGGLSGFSPIEQLNSSNQRRMIYAHKVRREREAVFGAFDCPDAGQSAERRRESTTPIQALNLLNSPFTIEVSNALDNRVRLEFNAERSNSDIHAKCISRVYQLALARKPTDDELAEAISVVEIHGLEVLCRAIFNSNEFLSLP